MGSGKCKPQIISENAVAQVTRRHLSLTPYEGTRAGIVDVLVVNKYPIAEGGVQKPKF
jgi:hypothetical protein